MEEDDVPSWVPRMSFDRSAYYPDLSEEYSPVNVGVICSTRDL
jgi:hypothetical protein